MRAHRSLVLAAAVLLGGGFVGRPAAIAKDDAKAAATAHLQWAKSTADAMAEARERGCVIFATYHGDGWKHCETMHRSVLEDAEFITWANEHVVLLVGHGRGSHGTIDVAKPAKGEPKKQCALYPGLTCEQHDQILKDTKGGGDDDKKPAPKKKDKDKDRDTPPAFPALKFDGIPASFVVTPDGKATDHKGDREPGACRTGLEAAQKAFDEHPIPASKLAAVRAAWADAEKVAKNGKPRPTLEALAKLEAAAGGALPQLWVARVKAKVDALDAKAVTRLADVRKGKDPEAVTKALEALRSEFDVPLASATPAVLAKLDEALGRAPAAAAEGDAPKGDAPGEPPAGEPSAGGEPPAPPK